MNEGLVWYAFAGLMLLHILATAVYALGVRQVRVALRKVIHDLQRKPR
ncbi:MAG: hypothetical protein AB7G93_16395 [Bdellovibrionales bacterium]